MLNFQVGRGIQHSDNYESLAVGKLKAINLLKNLLFKNK
jgi:hypothetical protein